MKFLKNYKLVSRVVSVGIILVLLLTSCMQSGSNGKEKTSAIAEDNVTAPGQLPICKQKITLTIGIPKNAFVEDYKTNAYTKWLEETANVDLKFYLLPDPDGGTKLQIMLASGTELPDIIVNTIVTDETILKYSSEKMFLPLNDYIDKNGYFIKRMFEQAQDTDVKKKMALADGNIYGLPKYVEQTGNRWNQRAWINKKWLDNLGLKVPETTDEFRQVLMAFKTQDPNKNGKQDEVPFTGYPSGWSTNPIPFAMEAFVYDDTINRYIVNDNKVDVAFNKDEWRDGLKYLNGLLKDGLLDPLCFTQDDKALKALGMAEGGSRLGAFTAGRGPDQYFEPKSQRILDYVQLPPLKGPKGVSWTQYNPLVPTNNGMITKYCKNPLAAFRLLDLMMSEESMYRSRFGVPDKDWVKAGPNDAGLFESIGAKPALKPILQFGGKVQNSHWLEVQPTFRTKEVSDGMVWDGDKTNFEYIIANTLPNLIGKAPKEIVSMQLFTLDEMNEIKDIRADINAYVKENTARFIVGDKNIDTEWDSYKGELEKMNLKKYLEISQKGYDRTK